MSRTRGSSGPKTLAAINEAGLDLIYTVGYEAMSLRELAAKVGLQPGSLYNHIETKQDLLFDLIHNHMVVLLARVDAELEGIEGPAERLGPSSPSISIITSSASGRSSSVRPSFAA